MQGFGTYFWQEDCWLHASFAALYAAEVRCGLTLCALAEQLREDMLPHETLSFFWQLLSQRECTQFTAQHKAVMLELLTPALNADWREMFKIYVGVMGKNAAEFWQLTLEEYALAFEGFCLAHGIGIHPPDINHDQLTALMARFPDLTP